MHSYVRKTTISNIIVLAVLIAFGRFSVSPAEAQKPADWKLCLFQNINKSKKPLSDDEQFSACNALIKSGKATGEQTGFAHRLRGFYYKEKGKYDLAIADFTVEAKFDPYAGFSNRSDVYELLKQYDRAIEDQTKIIEHVCSHDRTSSNCSNVYNDRARVYLHKEDYLGAIRDYTEANRIDKLRTGETSSYLSSRAEAYMKMKDYDHAIADFSAGNCCFDRLADAYMQKNDFSRAIVGYSESIQRYPANPDYYIRRGEAHEKMKELKKALIDFRTSITLNKDAPNPDIAKKAADGLLRVEQKLTSASNNNSTAPASANSIRTQAPNTRSLDCNDLTTIKTTDDFYSCANKSAAVSDKSASPATPSPAPNQKSAALTEDPFVTKAKAAVMARINDPNSARFQSVELRTVAGKAVACGIVDGKNSSTGKMDTHSFAFDGEHIFIKFVIAESKKPATGTYAEIVDAYFKDNTTAYNRLCK